MNELFFHNYLPSLLGWRAILLSFVLALVLSSVVAKVYQLTFRGFSWSRTLVQAFILGSVVSCLIMMAIGDNIARGIGIVGSLAIIRFRTNLRDPKDLVFVFAALGIGVACGVQSYATATIGAAVFCLAALVIRQLSWDHLPRPQALVRFQLPLSQVQAEPNTRQLVSEFCKSHTLLSMREVAQGSAVDYAYHITLHDGKSQEELLSALRTIEGIRGLSYVDQRTTVEV